LCLLLLYSQRNTCPPVPLIVADGRGLETLVVLACWKLALPGAVSLLRGNHESATCTLMYGFKGELEAKYGKAHWRVGRGRVLCAALRDVLVGIRAFAQQAVAAAAAGCQVRLPGWGTKAAFCSSSALAVLTCACCDLLYSPALQPVYAACKRLFSSLPLAAKIGQQALVLHGGLFRRQPQRSGGGGAAKNKRKRAHPVMFGALAQGGGLLRCVVLPGAACPPLGR
jgi:hypothetical protein